MILMMSMIAVKVIHLLIILITTFKEIIVLANKKSRGATARQLGGTKGVANLSNFRIKEIFYKSLFGVELLQIQLHVLK